MNKHSLIYWFDQQNKDWENMNQIQRVCPCCREVVMDCLYTKKSIFDINVTVCNKCASEERHFHQIKFNWIKETNSDKDLYYSKSEVIGV